MTNNIFFSDNNHWRFGWGDGLYNFTEQQKPLWVTFGPCHRSPKTFDLEMTAAVRRIADNTTKPIYVAMSGGIDSELIAIAMLKEKVEFKPVIVEFNKKLNNMDIVFAFEFCKRHQLTPEIINLDINAFIENCIHTPYILANCSHLLQMHIMHHIHTMGGIAVIGVGEQRYKRVDGQITIPVPLERIAVTHFMHAEQVEGVSAFYCYTPELMLSLLQEAKLLGFDFIGYLSHNIKEAIYRKYWPDLTPRMKLAGFEYVSLARSEAERALYNKYKTDYTVNISNKYVIPIDTLEKQLSEGLPRAG